jgi:S-adenosylmethionine-diacylgycerolhomoserine-N-methlytransferase
LAIAACDASAKDTDKLQEQGRRHFFRAEAAEMEGADNEKPEIVEFAPESSFRSDLRVLNAMFRAQISGDSQQDRLESFYRNQAELYDSYRHRMLHGRTPMIRAMPAPRGGVWVDLGGGTGSNLEYFGKSLNHFSKCVVVDLCPSLVEEAKKRVQRNGWDDFVDVVLGDATDMNLPGLPAAGTVDVVTFSYALTMIPDWYARTGCCASLICCCCFGGGSDRMCCGCGPRRAAIRNAFNMLKVGGYIAVCDFTVHESQWPGMGPFWKWIFAHDTVYPNEQHLPALEVREVECVAVAD